MLNKNDVDIDEFKELLEKYCKLSNQKYYMKILDTVQVINNSELAKRAEKSGCPTSGNMV